MERAGGNPLFLLALVGSADDAELPATVEDALRVELDHLEPQQRRYVGHAAVLGQRSELWLLAEMLGVAESVVTAALEGAPGFVSIEGGTVHFTHALRRAAAYEALPFRARRSAHSAAAKALAETSEPPSELLSRHCFEAREYERAWTWSLLAADRERAAFSPLDEIVFLERAELAARRLRAGPAAVVLGVRERGGDDLEVLGRYEEAERVYRRAAKPAADDGDRARLFAKVARQFAQRGEIGRGLRWCARAYDAVVDAPPGLRVAPELERGGLLFRRGDLIGSLDSYRSAAAFAAQSGDRRRRAEAVRQNGTIKELLGQSGLADLRRSVALLEECGDPLRAASAAINLGAAQYDRGDWDAACEWYHRCADRAEPIGDLVLAATARNNLAEIQSDRGELDAARHGFETALIIWRSSAYPIGVGVATGNLGRLERRAGNTDLAERHLAEADDVMRRIGAEDFLAEIALRRAELALVRGEIGEAAAALRAVDPGGAATTVAALHRTRALVAFRCGDLAGFEAELGSALRVAAEHRLRYERLLAEEIGLLASQRPRPALARRVRDGMVRLQITSTFQADMMGR